MNDKMGQVEVLKVLEEKGNLTKTEIAEVLDTPVRSVYKCLSRLVKHGEVEREEKTKRTSRNNESKYYIFRIKNEKKK